MILQISSVQEFVGYNGYQSVSCNESTNQPSLMGFVLGFQEPASLREKMALLKEEHKQARSYNIMERRACICPRCWRLFEMMRLSVVCLFSMFLLHVLHDAHILCHW